MRSLSPEQKYSDWKVKLALTSPNKNWNEEQISFLRSQQRNLTEEMFTPSFTKSDEAKLFASARNLFTDNELYLTFFIPHNFQSRLELEAFVESSYSNHRLAGGEGDGESDCECYWSIGCGMQVDCDENGCEITTGCGMFGTSNCVGQCVT